MEEERGGRMNSDLKSRTVFVGNILYDAKEEELLRTFQLVGPIKQFRLDYEKDTNQPKGYGFCEYLDPDYASSALRNLNKQEFKGRKLRVCHATNDKTNLKKLEVETDEYQEVMAADESTMRPAEIVARCTAKQKAMVLRHIMDLSDEFPAACTKIASDPELMRALTTFSPAFSQELQMLGNKLPK
eukprot:TRINITY_DN4359_c0_g2_i2.p1 TRINITY_DN4359_c0_g2~~TRINITY_DN4359_c0_g2_i2.p1  ORF type:complete len:186 (+),score=84.51 TRINITY_DN4359_c0_g2_i2:80-637(+)